MNELASRAGRERTSQQNLDYLVRGRNKSCRVSLLEWLGKELGVDAAFLSGTSNEIPMATALGFAIEIINAEMRSIVKSHSSKITLRIFRKVQRDLHHALLTLRTLSGSTWGPSRS